MSVFKTCIPKQNIVSYLQLTREIILKFTNKPQTFGTQTIVMFSGEIASIQTGDSIQYAKAGDYILRYNDKLYFMSEKEFKNTYESPKKNVNKVVKRYKKAKIAFVKRNVQYISVRDIYGSYFNFSYKTEKYEYNIEHDSDKSFTSLISYLCDDSLNEYDLFFVMWKMFRSFNRSKYTFLFVPKKGKKLDVLQKVTNRDREIEKMRIKNEGY